MKGRKKEKASEDVLWNKNKYYFKRLLFQFLLICVCQDEGGNVKCIFMDYGKKQMFQNTRSQIWESGWVQSSATY